MAFQVFFAFFQEDFLEFLPELCCLPYSYFSLPLGQLFLFMWVLSWKEAPVGQLWEFLGPTRPQWNPTLTWFLDWNLEIPLLVLALLRLTPDFSMLRSILEKSMAILDYLFLVVTEYFHSFPLFSSGQWLVLYQSCWWWCFVPNLFLFQSWWGHLATCFYYRCF